VQYGLLFDLLLPSGFLPLCCLVALRDRLADA
jgi:hypothetical protein